MSLNRKSGRWIFMAAHRAMRAQSGAAAIRARFSPHNGNSEANHVRHRLSTQVYTISHKQADLVPFQGNQMSTKTISSRSLFWHLDSELMSKMIVMLRSEKVTVWEWREWQMVLNQYSHSLARPHSKGLRRCAAPQNTQPASLSGKLKHLFFLWWESCGRRGHFWKVWLRLESCANFEWLMFWCKLYFFRPTLNTQPASWAIWWCSHRSPTLSALSSLLIVLLVVRLVWIGKTRRSFALKSFGSIIAWHSPCMMKKATGKAVK